MPKAKVKLNRAARSWVDALRSGKYKQTQNQLADDVGYCCLGVACELALKKGIIRYYSRSDGFLPTPVQEWLGLTSDAGVVKREDFDTNLTQLNDIDGYSFKKIATFIEKNADKLFDK